MEKSRTIVSALVFISALLLIVGRSSPQAFSHYQFLMVSATSSWTTPTNISQPDVVGFTADVDRGIYVDSHGNIHVVYHACTDWWDPDAFEIFYVNGVNGSWNAPCRLTSNDVADVHSTIVSDQLGNIHIAYRGSESENLEIFYLNKTGNEWSVPVNISRNENDNGVVSIAVDNHGHVHIVWQGNDGKDSEIFYSNNQAGFWSSPVNLTQNGQEDDYPSLIVDSHDFVHIVWEGRDSSSSKDSEIFYANNIEGPWMIENVTRNDIEDFKPSIALDNASTVHISYLGLNTSSYEYGVFYVNRSIGVWGTPIRISTLANVASHTSLAVDSEGKIHVVYAQHDGVDYEVFYASGNSDLWEMPANVTQNSLGDLRPHIFIDKWNYVHIVYYMVLNPYSGNPNVFHIKSTDPVVVSDGGGTPILFLIGFSFAGVAAVSAIAVWLLRKREVPFP